MPNLPSDPNQMPAFCMNACEEAQNMVLAYINASTKANMAAWKGFADMTHDVSSMMQEACTLAVDNCKKMVASKTPQEAADKQAAFLKGCLDGLVINGGKVSQTSLRITKEAMEPLARHTNDTMGVMMKNVAKTG